MLKSLSHPFVQEVVVAIELVGVAIIAVGAAVALTVFLKSLVLKEDRTQAIGCLRTSLGRSILIGLEFLVAADIINTVVVDMSFDNVASLAAIVAIRILLSLTLEVEIEGRWPWQHGPRDKR